MAYHLTRDDLIKELREQLELLKKSADSFDQGVRIEAKRLANTIRILLHDTQTMHSVLGQLGEKDRLSLIDTATPIGANKLPTAGLVMYRTLVGPTVGEASYEPRLEHSPIRGMKPFKQWWRDPVTKDSTGQLFSRSDYVLGLANKEGGSHVDPKLGATWADLTRRDSMGRWMVGERMDYSLGSPAPATVRQIAYEVDLSIHKELAFLLS